eukprot:TRINITY_DN12605_c0_g1_i1.p1 TRINITY_DN12605_c0_g1~~TRINITY_DN12605_c0_g1_i1.p1  ORF type:complete len:423 (-),score=46.98 TRINITY_DN12605_c0_g1_i1:1011-2192(-)
MEAPPWLECIGRTRTRSLPPGGLPDNSPRSVHVKKTLYEHSGLLGWLQARLNEQEATLNNMKARQVAFPSSQQMQGDWTTQLEALWERLEALEQLSKTQESRSSECLANLNSKLAAMEMRSGTSQLAAVELRLGHAEVQKRMAALEASVKEVCALQEPVRLQAKQEGHLAAAPCLKLPPSGDVEASRQPKDVPAVPETDFSPLSFKDAKVSQPSSPLEKDTAVLAPAEAGDVVEACLEKHDRILILADVRPDKPFSVSKELSLQKLRDAGGLSGEYALSRSSDGSVTLQQATEDGVASHSRGCRSREDDEVMVVKKSSKAMCLEDALSFGNRCYPLPASTYTTAFLDCVLSPNSATSFERLGRSYRAYFLHFLNLLYFVFFVPLSMRSRSART